MFFYVEAKGNRKRMCNEEEATMKDGLRTKQKKEKRDFEKRILVSPNFPNPDFIFYFNSKFSVYIPSFIENVPANTFYCQLLLFLLLFVCFFSLCFLSLYLSVACCVRSFGRLVSHAMNIKEMKLCHDDDDFVWLDCNKCTRCMSIEK